MTFSTLEARTGIEQYLFSTRSGYFCSSYDSKTIAERLDLIFKEFFRTTMKMEILSWCDPLAKSTKAMQKNDFYTLEARTGIEPVHVGFADRSVTTSPPGQTLTTLPFCEERHKI